MTTAQDPIAHAARLLREAAEELRQEYTLSSDRNNWIGEPEAKAAYDEHTAAAQALEDWEQAIGAGGVQPLRSILEGCKVVPLEPTPEMLAALMSPGEAEVLASSPSETFALMLMDRAGIRERYSAMLGAAPKQEAQEPATVPYQKLTDEIDLILSDPDTELSIGAKRALLWMRTWVSVPLYTAPQQEAQDATVAAFEAVRKKLCTLPRYSFVLDDDGLVRRAPDRTGNWIEFDEAHALFDPVSVEAALAAQGGK